MPCSCAGGDILAKTDCFATLLFVPIILAYTALVDRLPRSQVTEESGAAGHSSY